MKQIIIFMTLITIVGCNLPVSDEMTDAYYASHASGHSLFYVDEFTYLTSPQRVAGYITTHFSYKTDSSEEWINPETLYNRKYGDCEDFAIFQLNVLYFTTGIKGNLLLVDYKSRSVVEGGKPNHAIIEWNNQQYEPELGIMCSYPIMYRYTFNEVFN